MAVIFKTVISEQQAFNRIAKRLAGRQDFDGYLNVFSDVGDHTVSWSRTMLAEEFKAHVTEALQNVWEIARFWVVYERQDQRKDAGINDIRKAAIRLTRGYTSVIVVTFSLLGRRDSADDLELVLVCFREDFQRRNFRVRYEGKSVDL